MPLPLSAIRTHESSPSNSTSMAIKLAPASMELSTTSATAWEKSYPMSRSDFMRRFAEGITSIPGIGNPSVYFVNLVSDQARCQSSRFCNTIRSAESAISSYPCAFCTNFLDEFWTPGAHAGNNGFTAIKFVVLEFVRFISAPSLLNHRGENNRPTALDVKRCDQTGFDFSNHSMIYRVIRNFPAVLQRSIRMEAGI